MAKGKVEPFKSRYVIERSAYRINQDENIVHLRMLSPDNGKTHVEYFSYIIGRGYGQTLTTKIEWPVLQDMERKMNVKLNNTIGILYDKTEQLKADMQLLSDLEKLIK